MAVRSLVASRIIKSAVTETNFYTAVRRMLEIVTTRMYLTAIRSPK